MQNGAHTRERVTARAQSRSTGQGPRERSCNGGRVGQQTGQHLPLAVGRITCQQRATVLRDHQRYGERREGIDRTTGEGRPVRRGQLVATTGVVPYPPAGPHSWLLAQALNIVGAQ